MLRKLFGVLSLWLLGAASANATVVIFSFDVDTTQAALSQYVVGEYLFRSDGTFNALPGSVIPGNNPDHIAANSGTSLGGFTMRRIDGEAFTLFGVTHDGPATINGLQLPSTTSFETTNLLPIGPSAIVGVTSVEFGLVPNGVFRLAGFTYEVTLPNIPTPTVPLPAAGWVFLSAIGFLAFPRKKRATKNKPYP